MPQLEDQSALARRHRDTELLSVQAPDSPAPQLSVIMPAHDVGPWIRETLESLQAQTFTDFELIVVDDHSQDETSKILAEFAGADDRIRVISPDGRGGAHARNVGVLLARGRYLAFCDGDDIVPEGAYAALMAPTTDASPDIVFGDFLKFSPRRTWRPSQHWQLFDTPRTGLTLADEPGLLRHRACWNKAFRADFWREHDIVFPEVPRSNDIVPMTQAYAYARDIAIVPDIVYIYRDRPGATSMSSKASGTRSLVSYIEQELACDEILRSDGTPEARHRHAVMLANSDGWVHLLRYLTSLGASDDEPVEAEVVALIGQLVALIGDAQIPHASEVARRLVLALCEAGEIRAAALAVWLLDQPPLVDATPWFDGWTRVLQAIPRDSRFTTPEFVAGRWILRRVHSAVRAGDEEVPAEALAALLAELRPDALTTVGPLSMLDLLLNRSLTALREDGVDAFQHRLRSVRHTRAAVCTVRRAGRTVEITGTFSAREPVTVSALAIIGQGRRLHEIGPVQLTAGAWTARVRTDELVQKRSLALIGHDATGQETVIVPVAGPELREARTVSEGSVQLSAGKTAGAAVKIQVSAQPASRWRRALSRRLATKPR